MPEVLPAQPAWEYVHSGWLLDHYIGIVMVTAIGYDYLLTLRREVDYVWGRPWTWVSTTYVLVRYIGLCRAFICGFFTYPVFPTSAVVSVITDLVRTWGFLLFLAATDLMMVLRVYAMWNQSKAILRVLLCIYVPQVVISFIFAGIFNTPGPYYTVTIVSFQDLGISVCGERNTHPSPRWTYSTPNFALGATLLTLAIFRTLKESCEMYQVTKRWQPSQYLRLFVRDGILYFILRVSYELTGDGLTISSQTLVPAALADVLLTSMIPRFIITVRELYDRDLRNRWQGIDTGFGVLSVSDAGQDMSISTIGFADVLGEDNHVIRGEVDGPEAMRSGV